MLVRVRLHGVLSRYAEGYREVRLSVAEGATVSDVLDALATRHPGVDRRVRDETGGIRPHLNLFVDGDPLRELGGTQHRLDDDAELLILPAVSGG